MATHKKIHKIPANLPHKHPGKDKNEPPFYQFLEKSKEKKAENEPRQDKKSRNEPRHEKKTYRVQEEKKTGRTQEGKKTDAAPFGHAGERNIFFSKL